MNTPPPDGAASPSNTPPPNGAHSPSNTPSPDGAHSPSSVPPPDGAASPSNVPPPDGAPSPSSVPPPDGAPSASNTPSPDGAKPPHATKAPGPARVRLDLWLYAVRLFPSRSAATQACRAGRVRVAGIKAKAAQPIGPGDRITFRQAGRDRDVVVTQTLNRRVGAPIAMRCYEDHSPPPPPRQAVQGLRERGTGRPTKRERRQIDQLRGRR